MTEIGHWSTSQVAAWLRATQLGNLVQTFKDNGVDGPLLVRLDEDMLAEMGIDSKVRPVASCSTPSHVPARAHPPAAQDQPGCRGQADRRAGRRILAHCA